MKINPDIVWPVCNRKPQGSNQSDTPQDRDNAPTIFDISQYNNNNDDVCYATAGIVCIIGREKIDQPSFLLLIDHCIVLCGIDFLFSLSRARAYISTCVCVRDARLRRILVRLLSRTAVHISIYSIRGDSGVRLIFEHLEQWCSRFRIP